MVDATPAPSSSGFVPPPTGFNHRFGNTPLSAKDGFALERSVYAQHEYWEVAIRIDPEQEGYVKLSDARAVRAARHAVTSILLVVATEDRYTIVGLLAWPGANDSGQEQYAEDLLSELRGYGYDNLQKAQVLIYFTEADQHAALNWTPAAGYSFKVFDGDLKGTTLRPLPQTTPLPAPTAR